MNYLNNLKNKSFSVGVLTSLIAFLIPFGEIQLEFYAAKIIFLIIVIIVFSDLPLLLVNISKFPYLIIFILFSLIVSISAIFVGDIDSSNVHLASLISYFCFIFIVYSYIDSTKTIIHIILSFLSACFIVSLFATLQYITTDTFIGNIIGFRQLYSFGSNLVILGTSSNPNGFAMHFLVSLPVLLVFTIYTESIFHKILSFTSIIFLSYILHYTYSRGAMLSVILTYIFIALIYFSDKIFNYRKLLFIIAIISSVIITSLLLFSESMLNRGLLTLIGPGSEKLESIYARFFLYDLAISSFMSNFFTGIGFNQAHEYTKHYGFPDGLVFHNNILTIASELGIFGLLTFLTISIIPIQMFIKIRVVLKNNYDKLLVYSLFSVYISQFIFGFTHQNYTTLSYWLFYGLFLTVSKIYSHNAHTT